MVWRPPGWVVPSLPRGEAKTGGRCAGVDRVLVAAMSLVGPAGYLHAIRVAWCCRRVACRGL